MGYGRLLVGSQVISASYMINYYFAVETDHTTLQNTGPFDFESGGAGKYAY